MFLSMYLFEYMYVCDYLKCPSPNYVQHTAQPSIRKHATEYKSPEMNIAIFMASHSTIQCSVTLYTSNCIPTTWQCEQIYSSLHGPHTPDRMASPFPNVSQMENAVTCAFYCSKEFLECALQRNNLFNSKGATSHTWTSQHIITHQNSESIFGLDFFFFGSAFSVWRECDLLDSLVWHSFQFPFLTQPERTTSIPMAASEFGAMP